jgi:hypothetical protein
MKFQDSENNQRAGLKLMIYQSKAFEDGVHNGNANYEEYTDEILTFDVFVENLSVLHKNGA